MDEKENVLDLTEYQQKLDELKSTVEKMSGMSEEEAPEIDTTPKTPLEIARENVAKMKEERAKANAGLLDDIAKGMAIKIYMQKGKKTELIGDSTATKSSKEYKAMESILSGSYRAKKGMYYIEVSSEEKLGEEKPYIMQIKQGKKYVNDYLVKEGNSEDSKNQTISLTSSTSSSEQISSAYAAQIQAQKYDATTTMMSDAYKNLASIKNKKSGLEKLFGGLINTSA